MCRISAQKGLILKKYILFIFFCVLTLLWIGFIFANSAKTGIESGEASSAVVEFVESLLMRVGIEPDVSEFFIRKLAHFLEYAFLSLLICASVRSFFISYAFLPARYPFFALAPALSFFVASVDEFCVQANTVGRGPSFRDVCIDTSGALFAALLFMLAVYLIRLRKSKG